MKNKWIWILSCVIGGLLLLLCGLLVPAHLRAVDTGIIQRAGRNTQSLTQQGKQLVSRQNLGSAWLFMETALAEKIPGRESFGVAVSNALAEYPAAFAWGNDATLQELFKDDSPEAPAFTSIIIKHKNRQAALELMRDSPNRAVQELLRCRNLTNTVLFPPSASSSGQALDAALAMGGLLVAEGRLTTGLSDHLAQQAAAANRGESTQPLEQALMDLLILGQQFNWDQLATFVGRIEDAGTLHTLSEQAKVGGRQIPVLFSAVVFSGKPAAVARYITDFNQTAMSDLGTGVRAGLGGINELLRRNQILYRDGHRLARAWDWSWRWPWVAISSKWLAYLLSGFFLAAGLYRLRPPATSLERPLQVRGFHLVHESLFALGFLLVVLLLSEPFLAQDTRKEQFAFRLHVPTTGQAVPAAFPRIHPNVMNNMVLLTLLLFFVLQGLIYISCLVKLAEIRRQNVPARMKLRLLDNEDHLFDAGLYLGFVGTIISLIFVSLGVIKFSLMAAYSSTSFGIVFVCLFKIFNLRPTRRRLLLEAETMEITKSKR